MTSQCACGAYLLGRAVRCSRPGCAVIVSPAMDMRVEELETWLQHHGLGLSVSFKRCYSAELRTKIGDESIVVMEAKAADFGVAVISACMNYERENRRINE